MKTRKLLQTIRLSALLPAVRTLSIIIAVTLMACNSNVKNNRMKKETEDIICKTFDCLEKNTNTKIIIDGFFRKYTPVKSRKEAGYMLWNWEILLSDSIAIPAICINKDIDLSIYENKNVSVNCTIFYGIIIGDPEKQNATGYRIDIDLIKEIK